jgi:hypothetical protein
MGGDGSPEQLLQAKETIRLRQQSAQGRTKLARLSAAEQRP